MIHFFPSSDGEEEEIDAKEEQEDEKDEEEDDKEKREEEVEDNEHENEKHNVSEKQAREKEELLSSGDEHPIVDNEQENEKEPIADAIPPVRVERKIDECRRIEKLDEKVVNRIAAGEIIHRPANAVKEMIENSLDAGATRILVAAKDGGVKLLQIQDNGHGIRKEELPLVCVRFTTSKLRCYEDLSSIGTYGFRGEALASISHVAHVTIVSKTDEQQCAFKARYSDGAMVPLKRGHVTARAVPVAGVTGTQITCEDLFYNTPTRAKALRNHREQFQRIADVVTRYAVHNAGISFTCKKLGAGADDGGSNINASVHTQLGASTLDNIATLFGAAVSRELVAFKHAGAELQFSATGYISNPNYSKRRGMFILFINHRLVESRALRRGVESVYSHYLPKHTRPWIYLSLEIPPARVDVNVHPTKSEVHFLHQVEIIEALQQAVDNALTGCDSSRTYYSSQPLIVSSSSSNKESGKSKSKPSAAKRKQSDRQQQQQQRSMVRTDSKLQKIGAFLTPVPAPMSQSIRKRPRTEDDVVTMIDERDSEQEGEDSITIGDLRAKQQEMTEPEKTKRKKKKQRTARHDDDDRTETIADDQRAPVLMLTSVRMLLRRCAQSQSDQLRQLFDDCTFVGCCDATYTVAQHGTALYLLSMAQLSEALFYQRALQRFGNFSLIQLANPAPMARLIVLALKRANYESAKASVHEAAQKILDELQSRADMLAEYFGIAMNEHGHLLTLPQIVDGYAPCMGRLPMFLLSLYLCVDYSSEQACFDAVARQLARFYRTDANPADDFASSSTSSPSSSSSSSSSTSISWAIEHSIFPLLCHRSFAPPAALVDSHAVVEITRLEKLYRIFERC
jgi:DNA mismatch repair protein MLH1